VLWKERIAAKIEGRGNGQEREAKKMVPIFKDLSAELAALNSRYGELRDSL
jgi:hypothetical protein